MLKRHHRLLPPHPVWMCGMRPFFLLTLCTALALIVFWSAVLSGAGMSPAVPGGPLVWHAHELVFGFAMAAVAGFSLTALPEFSGTAAPGRRQVQGLVALWLVGRAGFWASGALSPALWVAALAQTVLPLALLAVLLPALRSPQGRAHQAFGWALVALAAASAGFYTDALQGQPGLRWLHTALGVLMLLIVVAASRISMRVVNRAIAQVTPDAPPYMARPPKRHLAALCITLYTTAQHVQPGSGLAGWLGLAAAAAVFHLMGDWHVGSALWKRRFPLLLYAMYGCMACGYGLLGAAHLAWVPGSSAGWHLLGMGCMGMGVYVVIAIAGRAHVGQAPNPGPWIPLGGALLLLGVAARVVAAWQPARPMLAAASICWCLAFGLLCWRIAPALWQARSDGQEGCQGPG